MKSKSHFGKMKNKSLVKHGRSIGLNLILESLKVVILVYGVYLKLLYLDSVG